MKNRMKKLMLTSMVGLLTLGILATLSPKPQVSAANYENVGITLALPTAYYDALKDADRVGTSQVNKKAILQKNIATILGNNGDKQFGNVGLLIGPRSSSSFGNIETVLNDPNSLSEQEMGEDGLFPPVAAKGYQSFGLAIHDLNDKGLESQPGSARVGDALDSLSVGAQNITNIGVRLLKTYNPTPLVEKVFNANIDLHNYPDNQLVALVLRNNDLNGIMNIMGSSVLSMGGGGAYAPSLTTVLLASIIIILFLGAAFSRLMNGRSSGENIRKIMIRLLVASIAVPIIAFGLTQGIGWLDDMTANGGELAARNDVEEHLNFADWYSLGFSLPDSVTLDISNNRIKLTPSDIGAINRHTYKIITGTSNPTDQEILARMVVMSSLSRNKTDAIFHKPFTTSNGWFGTTATIPWDTDIVFETADKLSLNDSSDEVSISNSDDYFRKTGLSLSGNTLSSNGSRYGISPLAAYNLMRTEFSQTGMKALPVGEKTIATVAFFAGSGALPSGTEMPLNPLVRFIATFTMTMAAIQGLFSIIMSGFGGIISGTARSTLGSASGFGQAIGGVIALVAGVFGVGLIMTISFGLLGEIQAIIMVLFSTADDSALSSALEPIHDAVKNIWIIGPLLAPMLKSISSAIVTIIGMLALPKFGAIPIRLFCEWMAGLPSQMAARVQQMENRFTGDHYGGSMGLGGGGGGSGNAATQMQAAIGGATKDSAGLGVGAAAVAGAALAIGGKTLQNKFGDNKAGDDNNTDNQTLKEMDKEAETFAENTTDEFAEGGLDSVTNDEVVDVESSSEQDASSEHSSDALRDSDEVSRDQSLHAQNTNSENVSDFEQGAGEVSSETSIAGADHDSSQIDTSEMDVVETLDTDQSIASEQSLASDAQTNIESMTEKDSATSTGEHTGDTMANPKTPVVKPATDRKLDGTKQTGGPSVGESQPSGQSLSKVSGKGKDDKTFQARSQRALNRTGKIMSAIGGDLTTGEALKQAAVGTLHGAASSAGLGAYTEDTLKRSQGKKVNEKSDTKTGAKGVTQAERNQSIQARNNRIAMDEAYRRREEDLRNRNK